MLTRGHIHSHVPHSALTCAPLSPHFYVVILCLALAKLNQIAKLLRLPESAAGEIAIRVCVGCKAHVERSTSRVAASAAGSRTSELYRAVRDARDRVDATLTDIVSLSG